MKRGPVVDTAADALHSGPIGGAGINVYDIECEQAVLTTHVADQNPESAVRGKNGSEKSLLACILRDARSVQLLIRRNRLAMKLPSPFSARSAP